MQIEEAEYRAPKTLTELKKMVSDYRDAALPNAEQARIDREFYDGKQIPAAQLKQLAERGQPVTFTNKIAPAINGMLGIIDRAASDPEAYPRSQSSRDAADLVTKVLRYVADRADFKKVKEQCSENFLIEGQAAAIVEFDGRNITVARIRYEDFIYDPLSKEHDFKDAAYLGSGKLLDNDHVKALFPEFDGTTADDLDMFGFRDGKSKWWVNPERKQTRVIDLYYDVHGKWHRAIFTSSQILFAGPSEYENDEGDSICPIVATSYEVSGEGDRYGPIRAMRPLQSEINARHSRLLHLVNHRQLRQTDQAAITNRNIARKEAARADGVLPFGYEAVTTPDLAQGQMLILQQSMADLDRLAPTPAILGRSGGANESGRARQILQQAGYTELARPFARLERLEGNLYRMMWFCARQHLTEPTIIRIADDPRAVDFMTINEPIQEPRARPVIDPATGQPVINPMTGQPDFEIGMETVGYNNRLAELDMDIVLSTVPDTVNLEQETFNMILEYASATKVSPFDPAFKALIEMSPMPNKREVLERLEASAQQLGGGQPDPMQLQAAQLGMEMQQSEIEKNRAKAFKDMSAAEAEQAAIVRKSLGLPN